MQGNLPTGKQRLSYIAQVSESQATLMLLIQNSISHTQVTERSLLRNKEDHHTNFDNLWTEVTFYQKSQSTFQN